MQYPVFATLLSGIASLSLSSSDSCNPLSFLSLCIWKCRISPKVLNQGREKHCLKTSFDPCVWWNISSWRTIKFYIYCIYSLVFIQLQVLNLDFMPSLPLKWKYFWVTRIGIHSFYSLLLCKPAYKKRYSLERVLTESTNIAGSCTCWSFTPKGTSLLLLSRAWA